MRTTNELTIRGDRLQLERLLERIEGLLKDGWRRDRGAEERLGRLGVRGPLSACFACTASGDRPAAGLWVLPRGPGELSVSRVVPLERNDLSAEEHDQLLEEFERDLVRPAAEGMGVATERVRHRHSVEDDLSSEAARLLRAFSSAADRHTPGPADRQRWNAFLIRAHRDESLLDPALLDEWLRQEGWPERERARLVGEFESARSLLAAYDEAEAQHR